MKNELELLFAKVQRLLEKADHLQAENTRLRSRIEAFTPKASVSDSLECAPCAPQAENLPTS